MSSLPSVRPVVQALHHVLNDFANQVARSSGFVQRASKMTGARFVQTLVFTWLVQAQATLEPMSQTAAALGLKISPQGIEERFSEAAATFLQQVLEEALRPLIGVPVALSPLLNRFSGVYLFDSTVIALPDCLASVWKGCGGRVAQGSAAALKVQIVLDLVGGGVRGVLQKGRAQDRNAPTQQGNLPKGARKIADLGYFNMGVLAHLHQEGVYFLSRVQVGTKIALADTFLDLVEIGALLRQAEVSTQDMPVRLGAGQKLPCRLLAVRLSAEKAQARRRKLHQEAKKKGQPVSQARLALCDWNLFVTNVPVDMLTLDEALVLVRVRWQIELLFKLWKSQGQVDTWRTQNPWRILCEVYAKLLGQIVEHWLFLVSCWQVPSRSLVKASQVVSNLALMLAATFRYGQALEAVLRVLQSILRTCCRMNKRKTKPNTYQLVLNPPPLGGLA